jgi:hypothetical protein
MPAAEQKPATAELGMVIWQAVGAAAEIAHNGSPAYLVPGHRHHVAVEVGDDPDRAGNDADLSLGTEGSRARARHVFGPGDRAYCALSWAQGLAGPQDVDEAEARIAATIRYWRAWLGWPEV